MRRTGWASSLADWTSRGGGDKDKKRQRDKPPRSEKRSKKACENSQGADGGSQ